MTTVVRQRFDVDALTEESPFANDSSSTVWLILEWWSAGFTGDDDYSRAGARFLDSDSSMLSETYAPALVITPALTWVYRSFSVEVPVGTRFIDVLMESALIEGLTNDGYWEEIKATLHRMTS